MPRLIWSPAALRDVHRLHRFLAEKNTQAAQRAVTRIREGMRIIAAQPGVGRPVPDMDPEFRERVVPFGESGYVVLYRLEGETALILAVRHQRKVGY